MSGKVIIAILAFLALVVVLPSSFAQNVGCCCDPVVKDGSFSTKVDCDALGFTFIGPPPSALVTCKDHCGAILWAPGAVACGNGICQPGETPQSCAADCAVVSACGSPTFKPAPGNLAVRAVKSEKALRLSYTLPCPADYLIVSRCEGEDCTSFQKIAEIPPLTSFVDESTSLEWNTDYTYQIVAHYNVQGDGDPATAVGNAGDIECSQMGGQIFCLASYSYDRFHAYLAQFGYGNLDSAAFRASFANAVSLTFAPRFNQAWQCNDQNVLIQPAQRVSCSAQNREFCVSDELGARCIRREACDTVFDPFGLFADVEKCEEGFLYRYCFFDKSLTVQNKCYSCDPKMSCYDYKSEGTCLRDNCGAGSCAWKSIVPDLGVGVCVDTRYNNCPLCSVKGTRGLENENVTSDVWDACREEKSAALSTANYPCFYDKDLRVSKGCDEATCADYSRIQCGSPPDGIRLDIDNKIADASEDVCSIGVCEYYDVIGCVKNADGSKGAGFQDCRPGNLTCEADYFPAETSLIPTGVAGRIDKLNIRIFDKLNKTAAPSEMVGKSGYRTYLCIVNATNACSLASAFSISTVNSTLILKNLVLKDGQKVLASLKAGNNTIKFFSRDAANNLEVVKSLSVFACDKCQGPTLLNLSVTSGRLLNNIIFTASTVPTFTLTFDEPTQVTYAEISNAVESISLSQLTAGFATIHKFTPTAILNGTYNFSLNGHNQKTIYMDPPGLKFWLVVDPSLAGVAISPPDNSVLNRTTIDMSLNFTRPVTLDKVYLIAESFSDPYVKKQAFRDITSLFKGTDNRTFTAKVDNVTGGKYVIDVHAQGFNTLPIERQSTFFISTVKPGFRLMKPAFGVTPYSLFNASVETALPGECRYVYDTPTAPNATDFQFFLPFTGTGFIHDAGDFTIPFNSNRAYPLHVYCNQLSFGVSQRTFNLTIDPVAPVLISAYAEPSVIAEQYIPGQNFFVTTLKAEMSKPGFCKYSASTSSFDAMEGVFPGFDLVPKKSNSVEINVTTERNYTYWVSCKGANQLLTAPRQVPFSVDTKLPLSVYSNTPQGFSTTNFTIGVTANKHVICYFGEQEDDTTACMGACRALFTQYQPIEVAEPANYTYYVKCATPAGVHSDVIEIPVIIDTTPPVMTYVDDSSSLNETPEKTWLQNKIRVAVFGEDEESGISHYLITLIQDKKVVFTDLASNRTDGRPFFISTYGNNTQLRLVNDRRYFFRVKAVSRVGLESEPMESDGIEVDTSLPAEECGDGEKSGNETDVDCGGGCNGCEEGRSCRGDVDCATNYCADGICRIASCEDSVQNGLESDVDCGGQACDKCENDFKCIKNSDCASKYCDIVNNICVDPPPCANEILDGSESDVDCGGPCDRCGDGKACDEQFDCDEGLSCDPDTKVCTTKPIGDDDLDKILDNVDACLNTPAGETADEKGCSPSQKFSLGDEIDDKWRMDYFGCIECPEASLDADPDKDKMPNGLEYKYKTNPTKADTDGDRWKDGVEVERGFSPTDASNHPQSAFLSILWFLLVVLIIAALGYGGYIALKAYREKKPEVAERPMPVPVEEHKLTVEDELSKLKSFAKKEEIEEKDWIDLAAEIKKKPLPPKKFADALERLRKIAEKEKPLPEEPLKRLHAMLEELPSEARSELLEKLRKLHAGLLSKDEIERLFARLKITAEYYKAHKEEFDRELALYGKRHKHRK